MFNRRLLFNGAGGGNVVNHDFGLRGIESGRIQRRVVT